MRVVKLGGSLADWPELPTQLARFIDDHQIIVPGGGPFADQVRAMQRRWAFDDRTAHDMALLAMAQFGRMLAGIEPNLTTCRTLPALLRAVQGGASAVWLPDPSDPALKALPACWDVTSDSLAAWLARNVDAQELVLVKSVTLDPAWTSTEDLRDAGIVDRAFPASVADARFSVWLCDRTGWTSAAKPCSPAPGWIRMR